MKKISLNEDNESKEKSVLSNAGRQVIIRDFHVGMIHGILNGKSDGSCYGLKPLTRMSPREFHYHDLEEMYVLSGTFEYPLPEVKSF